jgi:hypothetical protein
LFGTLSPDKSTWKNEARQQRENYYVRSSPSTAFISADGCSQDLVRRLLEPIDKLPEPTTPLSPQDNTVVEISKEFTHVPRGLFVKLEEEPEAIDSCPLDPAAPEEIKIACALALDTRLRLIREHESQDSPLPREDEVPEIRLESTPEIRLEGPEDHHDAEAEAQSATPDVESDIDASSRLGSDSGITPEISLSVPGSPTSVHSGLSTTLLASRAYSSFGAHPRHASSLLRLLYLHSSLNPAHRSPQIASLLVPLYSALAEEADPEDAAHVEADAFWLFEAMIGEFSELEDAEGGNLWMQKLGQRTAWADTELVEDLVSVE